MRMIILNPGPLSTIQDAGRFGFQSSGIGTSGAMDMEAYRAANELVGNGNQEAVIEATLMGPMIQFQDSGICAITGADMAPQLDGTPVEMYQPFPVTGGQTLSMGFAGNGCRAYIAFAGGIDVPVVMNSRSTNLKCHIGGLDGRALQKDDELITGRSEVTYDQVSKRKKEKPVYEKQVTVRVIEGPQDDYFSQETKSKFYGSEYTVSAESDRMGMRLEGEPVMGIKGVDIISDGIAPGSIQITSAGQPIILLADRQTTGGYAKIATVISDDLPKLAQLTPGGKVSFVPINIEEIEKMHKRTFFQKLWRR